MSGQKNHNLIELAVLLIALLALAWFASGQTGASVAGGAESGRLLGQVDQLRQQLELLHAKSANYLEQAPRNYDDYFRDTRVIHASLQLDIAALDTTIREDIAVSPGQAAGDDQAYLPEQERAALIAAWREFHDGLVDQLGVDPEMPRLEWGFRHINEQTEPLLAALDAAVAPLRDRLESSGPVKAGSGLLLGGILAWSALMAAWFGIRVRRAR